MTQTKISSVSKIVSLFFNFLFALFLSEAQLTCDFFGRVARKKFGLEFQPMKLASPCRWTC
jgi:hypothetical protein